MSSFLGGGGGSTVGPGSILATMNLVWYVSTTGSDSNNGLTPGTAFATIQHAINVAFLYNYQYTFSATINVADGIYTPTSPIELSTLVNNTSAFITGDIATPANCIIDCTTSHIGYQTLSPGPSWTIRGFQLQNSSFAAINLASPGAALSLDDLIFSNNPVHIRSTRQGNTRLGLDNFTFTFIGNIFRLFRIEDGSSLADGGSFFIFSGAQVASQSVMYCNQFSFISAPNGLVVNPGNITGPRFELGQASILSEAVYADRSQFVGSTPGKFIAPPGGGQVIDQDPFYSFYTPTNGSTVIITPGDHRSILTPAGPIAGCIVDLPTNMVDGEQWIISTTANITAVTWTTLDGSTIIGAPAGLAATTALLFLFDGPANKWYCMGV